MNWKQIGSLSIFGLFIFLSIAHNVPGFLSYVQSLSFAPLIGDLFGIALVLIANTATVYQLWTGKASSWDWASPQTGYQGWIQRSEHPVSYWFRVALFLIITVIIDAGLVLALITWANGNPFPL